MNWLGYYLAVLGMVGLSVYCVATNHIITAVLVFLLACVMDQPEKKDKKAEGK